MTKANTIGSNGLEVSNCIKRKCIGYMKCPKRTPMTKKTQKTHYYHISILSVEEINNGTVIPPTPTEALHYHLRCRGVEA